MSDMSKVCKKCNAEKDLKEFAVCSDNPKWRMGICRDCKRERDNEYSQRRNVKDRDKVNARNARWVVENREKVLERKKKYNRENREELVKKQKECRKNKMEQYRKVARLRAERRRKSDINFRLKDVLRKRMRNALLGLSKADRTMNLIGCSMDELKIYLEKQFREGMNWGNYGLHGWHIDHILPCCSFDLKEVEEQKKCFHYTNLRPLWAEENWAKGAQDKRQVAA